MRRTVHFLISIAILAGSGIANAQLESSRRVKFDSRGVPLAAPEAAVDKVAYAYQRKAIQKVKKLLRARRNSAQEPVLLMRLARMQQENADVVFRIAHAEAFYSKKPIKLKNYHRSLRESVRTLSRYVNKYPKLKKVPFAYRMRARAFAEIGDKDRAVKDYRTLIDRFPRFELVNSAYLALAEYSEEEGDYRKAIKLLKRVLATRIDPEYPYALFKLSWDYFALNDIDTTFKYVRKYLAYYNERIQDKKAPKRNVISAQVLRDDLLVETPLFYMRGNELGLPRYQISQALNYFRRLAIGPSTDDAFGKMFIKFTKLLRSRNHERALVEWKDRVLASEMSRPQVLDVLILVYEDQMNKYRYKQMLATAKDMTEVYARHKGKVNFDIATNLLLKSGGRVQKIIKKQMALPKRKPSRKLHLVLAGIYQAFLNMIGPKDDRLFKVKYNIAEALAGAERYEDAIDAYIWVMKNGDKANPKALSPLAVTNAGYRAVGLRYDIFKDRKMVPSGLTPKALDDDKNMPVSNEIEQWLKWLAWVQKRDVKSAKKLEDLDFYFYESNRMLYSQGHIRKGTDRMLRFVKTFPTSELAIPAAELVLDTMIASKDWERTYKLAQQFSNVPAWKRDKKLNQKLFKVAANSFYKRGEELFNSGNHEKVVSMNPTFKRFFYKSERRADWLNLVGRAALAMKKEDEAMGYFANLLADAPNSQYTGSVLLLRAGRAEKMFKYEKAALDYRQYLNLPANRQKSSPKEIQQIREKIMLLAWLSERPSLVVKFVNDRKVCTKSMFYTCDQYHALALVGDDMKGRKAVRTASKRLEERLPASNRALWSVVMLESNARLNADRRLALSEQIVQGWKSIDPLAQYSLLSTVSVLMPSTFELLRMELSKRAPVRANEKSIARRLNRVQQIEEAASRVVRMPFARVQASVLNEVAGMYIDLAHDIQVIRPPGGLSAEDRKVYRKTMDEVAAPFAQTGKKIRSQAFRIASRSGIEDGSFQIIARPYFDEHPKVGKRLLPKGEFFPPKTISFEMLDMVDSSQDWKDPVRDPRKETAFLKSSWVLALKNQQWSRVAYLLGLAKQRGKMNPGVLGVMRGISLAQAGARAEGLAVLEVNRKHLNEKGYRYVTTKLVQNYISTLGASKVRRYLEELDDARFDIRLSDEESTFVSALAGDLK